MELTIDGHLYDDIVPRDYKMDPASDELLYADELENGMVVLLSDSLYDETESSLRNDGLLEVNRWCEVSKVRSVDNMIYFIGIYTDGNKRIRHFDGSRGLLVKRETITYRSSSIPQPADGSDPTCHCYELA